MSTVTAPIPAQQQDRSSKAKISETWEEYQTSKQTGKVEQRLKAEDNELNRPRPKGIKAAVSNLKRLSQIMMMLLNNYDGPLQKIV